MDDFTIHLNVRFHKINDKNIAFTKERIWRPLVSFNTWVLKGFQMPGFVVEGLGLVFITNMAIIVEGILTDIIDEFCVHNNITPNWGVDLEFATWVKKKKKYNSIFSKKIESYLGYDSVEILFQLRNNVAHGLSHIEESSTQVVSNMKSDLKSTNFKYEAVRKFFIDRGLMKPTVIGSNSNQLWQFNNVLYLWHEVNSFIEDILKQNESSFNEAIISEWETATKGRG